MALPPIQTVEPLAVARRDRAELLDTMRSVQRALAAPTTDPGWLPSVTGRLGLLRSAFVEHTRVTEGPDGLYAELLEYAPRLAYRVRGLVRAHAALSASIDAVCARMSGSTPEEVRGWAGNLLRDLSRHRQLGADLVYDAYATDIGGET